MEDLFSKEAAITELCVELSVGMDKIVYLDSVLANCPNTEMFDKYNALYNKEVLEHLDTKKRLQKTLDEYMEFEAANGVPINMAYRLLSRTLKET